MNSFSLFDSQHLATILAIAAGMIAVPWIVRRSSSATLAGNVGLAIAVTLLFLKFGEPVWRLMIGHQWQSQLPLHLCDVGAIAIGFALISRNPILLDLGYFWGLGGGLQAVMTPDLNVGFPDVNYVVFFLTHGLCLVAVSYSIFVYRYRPNVRSIWRAFGFTVSLASVIIPVNLLLETNYLFLSHKPGAASLMDFLGPAPWYVLSLVVVSVLFFFIYYTPFVLADVVSAIRKRNSKSRGSFSD